ncbi:MAG: aminoacyl-tRNA hydrolase [Thermoplasmata archaeon]
MSGSKMVLVVRGELRLTTGKVAAQVAHGAVILARRTEREDPARFREWWRTGQRKVVLEAATLPEMEQLELRARARKVPAAWVEDAGLTEVAPGTRTCLALGPAQDTEIDPVTGQLPLL